MQFNALHDEISRRPQTVKQSKQKRSFLKLLSRYQKLNAPYIRRVRKRLVQGRRAYRLDTGITLRRHLVLRAM